MNIPVTDRDTNSMDFRTPRDHEDKYFGEQQRRHKLKRRVPPCGKQIQERPGKLLSLSSHFLFHLFSIWTQAAIASNVPGSTLSSLCCENHQGKNTPKTHIEIEEKIYLQNIHTGKKPHKFSQIWAFKVYAVYWFLIKTNLITQASILTLSKYRHRHIFTNSENQFCFCRAPVNI